MKLEEIEKLRIRAEVSDLVVSFLLAREMARAGEKLDALHSAIAQKLISASADATGQEAPGTYAAHALDEIFSMASCMLSVMPDAESR